MDPNANMIHLYLNDYMYVYVFDYILYDIYYFRASTLIKESSGMFYMHSK